MPPTKHGPWGCTCKTSSGRCWSVAEVTALELLYGTMSDAALAVRLGRGVHGVRAKAIHMGFRKADQTVTARDAAWFLGLTAPALRVLVREGYLHPRRAGYSKGRQQVWNFTESELLRFLRDTPWMIDWYRMPYTVYKRATAEWLSPTEVAERLGVRVTLITWLHRTGRISEAHYRRRRVMIPASVVPSLLDRVQRPWQVHHVRPRRVA